MKTTSSRPQPSEYAPYYAKYIDLVPEDGVLGAMRSQLDDEFAFLHSIPEAQATILHPPYTWTIKQVINHLADGERIFNCRALRFARGDGTPLPGFDENQYARTAGTDELELGDLVREFESVRRATIALFENLPEAAWTRQGVANDNPASVRALARVIVGHARHHLVIVRTRVGASHAAVTTARSR